MRAKRACVEDRTAYVPPEGLEEMKNLGCPHGRWFLMAVKPSAHDTAAWWLNCDCQDCVFAVRSTEAHWRMYCVRGSRKRRIPLYGAACRHYRAGDNQHGDI